MAQRHGFRHASSRPTLRHPPVSRPSRRRRLSIRRTLLVFLACFLVLGTFILNIAMMSSSKRLEQERRAPLIPQQQPPTPPNNQQSYKGWRDYATNLAALPARDVVDTLQRQDPFGVRRFEALLMEQESKQQRLLDLPAIQSLFPCPPPSERITVPDQRDLEKARDFRSGQNFLFFQHLRKAGGTNFCTLAEKNLPKSARPDYYCMPDMEWSNNKGAGYLHHWDNEEIIRRMKESGYRIAGNEWDNFDTQNHFELPAVFCTSFRQPLDRALSQFRFECIEDRGCKIKNVTKWWEKRRDLINVYTWTFANPKEGHLKKIYEDERRGAERSELLGNALDTVSKFHLVLVMEWLGYAGTLVQDVLGFRDLSALTHRVRPFIGQFQRNDGQEENKLGAAGIAKASWVGKDFLDETQYQVMTEHLAIDEILTDAARRMFLERLVCQDRI